MPALDTYIDRKQAISWSKQAVNLLKLSGNISGQSIKMWGKICWQKIEQQKLY